MLTASTQALQLLWHAFELSLGLLTLTVTAKIRPSSLMPITCGLLSQPRTVPGTADTASLEGCHCSAQRCWRAAACDQRLNILED
jgi:hypothetical protein